MTVFLFWNLNKKPLESIIADLAKLHNVDVLMFAECNIPAARMLETLNQSGRSDYFYAPSIACEKIAIYTRFSVELMRLFHETDRLTIRHLSLPGLTDILLAVTHLPSKLHWDEASQAAECMELARQIRIAEENIGHQRTILVGDLNMNPFENGVVIANGLHAVMARHIAEKENRKVLSQTYPFFYNPMWGLFGDRLNKPPGTYYYANSEHKVYFWNMFDQVLIRPSLLSSFVNESLEIIKAGSNQAFLSERKIPNTKVVSDHLPIRFELKL